MDTLPEKKPMPRVRKVYAELTPDLYIKLELEAYRRDLSPYKLASAVLGLYLSGALVDPRTSSAPSPSPSIAGGISASAD